MKSGLPLLKDFDGFAFGVCTVSHGRRAVHCTVSFVQRELEHFSRMPKPCAFACGSFMVLALTRVLANRQLFATTCPSTQGSAAYVEIHGPLRRPEGRCQVHLFPFWHDPQQGSSIVHAWLQRRYCSACGNGALGLKRSRAWDVFLSAQGGKTCLSISPAEAFPSTFGKARSCTLRPFKLEWTC